MAIIGINFNDFGSRKLRFDSQRRGITFNGEKNPDTFYVKYGIPNPRVNDDKKLIKYAVPPQPMQPSDDMANEEIFDDNSADELKVIYGIPSNPFDSSDMFFPSSKPAKPSSKPNNEPPVVKYGYPPAD